MTRFACLLTLSLVFAGTGMAAPVNLNPVKSEIKWKGKKKLVSDDHVGTIALSHGYVNMQGGKVTAGEIHIDMSSIVNTDIGNPKYNKKLVGHLKSDDFFHTSAFPFATFKITKGGKGQVSGDLTIRGKTRPKTIKLSVKPKGKVYEATGSLVFDRSKFDVKYNSETFFSAAKLGDKIIDNSIQIDFRLVTSPPGTRQVRVPNIMKGGKKTWLPAEIRAAKGEKVQLVLVNTLDAPHGFEIKGVVKAVVVPAASEVLVDFTAAAAGDYEFRCHMHPAHVGGRLKVGASPKI